MNKSMTMSSGADKAAGTAQTAHPGSASCKEQGTAQTAPVPEGTACTSHLRNCSWSAQGREEKPLTACTGFPGRNIKTHLGIWEISR